MFSFSSCFQCDIGLPFEAYVMFGLDAISHHAKSVVRSRTQSDPPIPYLGAGKCQDWDWSWSVHVYWICYGRSSSTEAVKKILRPLPLKRSKQKMPWLEWWDAKLTGRNRAHPPLGRANQQWSQNATPNCRSFQHAKAIAYLPIHDGGCSGEVWGHGHAEDVSSLNQRFLNVNNKVENNTVRTRTGRLLKMIQTIQTSNVPRTSICPRLHLRMLFVELSGPPTHHKRPDTSTYPRDQDRLPSRMG